MPGPGPTATEDYYYRRIRARGPEDRSHGPNNRNKYHARAGPVTGTMPGPGPTAAEDYYYTGIRARGPEDRAHGPQKSPQQ
jgi:hypothetical protein